MIDAEIGERFGGQVPQIVVRGRAAERSLSVIGERAAEDTGREMGCMGVEDPSISASII
jgi:hypothetical protein